jgi:glycosyltransferase involved in cell wall biosynthesis
MRVAFDARLLERPRLRDSGIGRYASCLLAALRDAGAQIVELRSLPRPPAPERIAEGWEHLLLARDVRRADADLLHSPSIELVSLRPGAPLVVTLHDLVPLKQREQYLRTGLKHRLRWAAVRRAARVIVPSRSVAEEAIGLLALPPERVVVVPEAPAPSFRPVPEPRAALERLALPEHFLLWVGDLDPPDPRKGVAPLAEAVRTRGGVPLVLAGRAGEAARALADGTHVRLAGRLPDAELAALYSAADALVFPSGDEGFGLPPLEALACGTPVAAFAAGALPETLEGVGGAALVPPGAFEKLLDAAERLTGTRVERPDRTWGDVARDTVAAYEAALAP